MCRGSLRHNARCPHLLHVNTTRMHKCDATYPRPLDPRCLVAASQWCSVRVESTTYLCDYQNELHWLRPSGRRSIAVPTTWLCGHRRALRCVESCSRSSWCAWRTLPVERSIRRKSLQNGSWFACKNCLPCALCLAASMLPCCPAQSIRTNNCRSVD